MRPRYANKARIVMIVTYLVLTISMFAEANDQQDLAKESQNPIGNIISLPFENNFDFGVGPEDALVYALNIKPVYPVNFAKWNLINRGIFPVIYQEGRIEGEGTEFGLGNFTYQAFFSPATPGKVIWGAGPAFIFPTNTDDRLGGTSGRRVRQLWPWPNPDPGWSARWFKMCGPTPATTMLRMLTFFHSSILSTTISKADGTFHQPQPLPRTGKRTVTIAGLCPLAVVSAS